MDSKRTALVLGATGGIGGEVARRLVGRGWTVRALHRDPSKLTAGADATAGLVWLRGDAMSATDVAAAAHGASVIVHAVNPPGYRNWSELVLPMLDNTIAAACASGARIVLPARSIITGRTLFQVSRKHRRRTPSPGKAGSGSKWSGACKPPLRTAQRS